MSKLEQDMEGNSKLNVDGNTSEEEEDEEYADYVEKKMRLAAKTELQPWSQSWNLKLLDFLPKSVFCKIISMLLYLKFSVLPSHAKSHDIMCQSETMISKPWNTFENVALDFSF